MNLEYETPRGSRMVLDVPPTSENLARLLFEWCTSHLSLPAGVSVAAVRVAETASSFAEYTPARP